MNLFDYQPLKITDVLTPEIVDGKEFADTMNQNCSFKTDYGRELSQAEIATLKVVRLEKQVADLQQQIRALAESLTAGK